MEATLRTPSGASIKLDLNEQDQALTLTLDVGGEELGVRLPEKSASALHALLSSLMASRPWGRA